MTVTYEGSDYWLHDLSPFIIQFSENWGIRWYGFAYVLGFLTASWMLTYYFTVHRKFCMMNLETALF